MADRYWTRLGRQAGLHCLTGRGPFLAAYGALLGRRRGYVVALGPARAGRRAAVGILIRFRRNPRPELLRTAIEYSRNLNGNAPGILAEANEHSLVWLFPYWLRRPRPEQVSLVLDGLLEAVASVVPAFDSLCELCRHPADSLTLLNGMPGYYCDACKERILRERDTLEQAYDQLPASLPRALVWGTTVTVLGTAAWVTAAWLAEQVLLLWGGLLGILIGLGVLVGAGKVTRMGQMLAGLLTLTAAVTGHLSLHVLHNAALSFPRFWSFFLARICPAEALELAKHDCLVGAAFTAVGTCVVLYHMRRPRLRAVFETIRLPRRPRASSMHEPCERLS